MPGGDRTGPNGQGPMTGRAAGFCAGYSNGGYASQVGNRGFWGRCRSFWNRGGGRWQTGVIPPVAANAGQELSGLREQAQFVQNQLAEISQRVEQLEAEIKSKK